MGGDRGVDGVSESTSSLGRESEAQNKAEKKTRSRFWGDYSQGQSPRFYAMFTKNPLKVLVPFYYCYLYV